MCNWSSTWHMLSWRQKPPRPDKKAPPNCQLHKQRYHTLLRKNTKAKTAILSTHSISMVLQYLRGYHGYTKMAYYVIRHSYPLQEPSALSHPPCSLVCFSNCHFQWPPCEITSTKIHLSPLFCNFKHRGGGCHRCFPDRCLQKRFPLFHSPSAA